MKKTKILVIEDDKSLVHIIEQAFNKDQFVISLALGVEEGIKKAKAETYGRYKEHVSSEAVHHSEEEE